MTEEQKEKKLKDTVALAHQIFKKLNSIGVPMWLEYGSALGAVRDGGVIKNDKDIDIAIWWKDWKKLKDVFFNDSSSFSPCFYNFINCHSGGYCYINSTPVIHSKEFHIEIWGFEEYDGIRSSAINYGKSLRSKLYYQKNLKKIYFEKLIFYVSKYAEKYLDYLYRDIGGKGITWRTPITQAQYRSEERKPNWISNKITSWNEEDKITGYGVENSREGLSEKMNQIFDKVIIAPKKDDIITVGWMEKNNIDYIVHYETDEDYLRQRYYGPMSEERLLLMKSEQKNAK